MNKIGFQNIRIFKELTEFELKPITLLTGTNNSGKSAMQKMLLLLSNGFEYKNNEIQLDSLIFKKELINKTGDFKSNVNYDNQNNRIHFTFEFEDDIFTTLNAELIYEGNESGVDATLVEISISDFEEKLLSLKKVPNKDLYITKNDWIWKWNLELCESYLKILHKQLLNIRNEGERDIMLKNISIKLDPNCAEPLTPLEDEIYNDYKKRGIIAFDSRATEIIEDNYYEPGFPNDHIYDENTNWIWRPNKINNQVFEAFPSTVPGSNFLIYTKLLDEIGNDFNQFLSKKDKKHKELRDKFINNGITDSEKFALEYCNFEFLALFESFNLNYRSTIIEAEDNYHDVSKSKSINEILGNPQNGIFYINTLSDDNGECKIVPIIQSLYPKSTNNQNYIPISNEMYSIISGKPLKEETVRSPKSIKKDTLEETEDFFNMGMSSIPGYFLKPFENFIKSLEKMLNKTIIISANSKIKKQYLYGDYDTNDSAFLLFGEKYFVDDYSFQSQNEFISKWLKELQIADALKVSKIKLENTVNNQHLGFYFSLIIDNKEVSLYDCGSGIHQIVYLLINIVNASYRKTILLEEPETNLHPMLQSKLADMFVEINKKYYVKIIAETHSEYIIRRMQYLVAKSEFQNKDENTIAIANDKVLIYYFNTNLDEYGRKVYEINFSKNGQLSESFGKGFLDETTTLQFELYKLNNSQSN